MRAIADVAYLKNKSKQKPISFVGKNSFLWSHLMNNWSFFKVSMSPTIIITGCWFDDVISINVSSNKVTD